MSPLEAWPEGDRRQAERRRQVRRRRSVAVAEERRSGKDRRRQDRRSGRERRRRTGRDHHSSDRRLTPLPYARDEAIAVRDQVAAGKDPTICPSCGGTFEVGPPVTRAAKTVREYRCSGCHRAVIVGRASE